MYLTKEQERMLSGELGEAYARALKLIVKVGEALGATRLVEIVHAHVSGISFLNIMEPGAAFIRDLASSGARARVYTTINPGCMDYLGLSANVLDVSCFAGQELIDDSLGAMGFKLTHTCIPYYHRPPSPGEHLAWGESSAVAMANSFYGAMTNREGGPVALASALTGYTYYSGLHVLENRTAKVLVKVDGRLLETYPGLVGLWLGESIKEIPLVRARGLGYALESFSAFKLMLAASAASGAHDLVVLDGITPRNTYLEEIEERVEVDRKDLEEFEEPPPSNGDAVLGYIGCPHLHPYEFVQVFKHVMARGKPLRDRVLMLTVPRDLQAMFYEELLRLRAKGVRVLAGTCPVVSRLLGKFDVMVTNSGKAAFYTRISRNLRVRIETTLGVVKAVYGG
ncbi:MAG: aconitase X catalytic domain-containing protein [Desulfurococcaceae archaeon]